MNRREHIRILTLASAGAFLGRCGGRLKEPLGKSPGESSACEKLILAYRLHPGLFETSENFNATAKFLKKYPGAVDELALFDETLPSAPCAPLDYVEKMTGLLSRRIRDFRELGISSVGINVLNNLGHGNRPGIWEMPYRPMTGHDGRESLCPCPNDPAFRDYLKQRYALMASAGPDFIWMDDDFRMVSHGVTYPCFCPVCLEKFGWENGRQDLVDRLNGTDGEPLRKAWTEFCSRTLESLAAELKQTVAEVDPSIATGLMTIGYSRSTYARNDFGRWMKAFGASMGRPGHGYYHDRRPRLVTGKIMDVARQVRDYPGQVKKIEYELENWPYITLNKSRSTLLAESMLSLMAGCNGIAFNIFYERENANLEEYEPVLKNLTAHRMLMENINRWSGGTSLQGFWPADNPQLMENITPGPEGWFREGNEFNIQRPNELAETGIPFTPDREQSCGILLPGRITASFDNRTLEEFLSGPVYMDTAALSVLHERGLGHLAGVRAAGESIIAFERFAGDALNEGLEGTMRRATGWSRGDFLIPENEQVREISHLHHMSSGRRKGCCLSLLENRLGGRVAVSSYHPWGHVGMLAKVRQLTRLMDHLSNRRMPVRTDRPCRLMPMIRMNPEKTGFILSLFNNSFDDIRELPVTVRTACRRIRQVLPGRERKLPFRPTENGITFTVEHIAPWGILFIAGD